MLNSNTTNSVTSAYSNCSGTSYAEGISSHATGYCVASDSAMNSITWTYPTDNTFKSNAYNSTYTYLGCNLASVSEIFSYLLESELQTIITCLKDRGCSEKSIRGILLDCANNRQFTEEFLLKNFEYFEPEFLKRRYATEINTQQFPSLALLLNV